VWGTKGLVGNTFNRNIFYLKAATEDKSLRGFMSLIKHFEAEALGAGARKISIFGGPILNKGFLNPGIARRLGYTFAKAGDGVILQKILIP
jgi:hypothetical protein